MPKSITLRRGALGAAGGVLVLLAFLRVPPPASGQGAVPLSKPGQEDLTFWANHNGLEQLDINGEVGFGDMARILMRRRANAPLMRELRDRFTFKTRAMAAIATPDVFRAEVGEGGLVWRNCPRQFVIGASQTFNLPVIVENTGVAPVRVTGRFAGTGTPSEFRDAEIAGRGSAGYFLRVVESEPGSRKGRLTLSAGGRELQAEIAFDVRPLVDLRVNLTEANGKAAAARVYLTASNGLAYAPAGSISRFTAMSAENFFHAEGSFSVDLPAGETLIEATCGQEYGLTARKVNLVPGAGETVTLQLKRWIDMADKGWYSSDAHIHANYTGDQHQTINPRDVRLYAHAEDLNNSNLMVANSGSALLHDIQYFEGRPNALSDSRFILYWNEEMRNRGFYGHVSFFNLKKLVYPVYTGFANTPYAEDYPPMFNQADAARKQGGAVTYVHPANSPATFEGIGGAGAKELPVDVALNAVDAIDVVSNLDEIAAMEIWYRLLNCGFRLAISAGTDSFTNVADHYTPGGGRVYVHSGNPLRYDEWVRAYKQGRSFASNGPVVLLTVNGKEPGEDLRFPAGSKQRVRVKATMITQVPVDTVDIVVKGKVVSSRNAKDRTHIEIDEELPLSESSWIAVRAIGPWHRLILNDAQAFAHTGAVYVQFGDQRVFSREDVKFYDDWIGKLIATVKERGRFVVPAHREEVIDLFQRAQSVYRQLER